MARRYFLGLAILGVFGFARMLNAPYWDFRNNVWAVSRLVASGPSPVDDANIKRLSQAIGEPLARGLINMQAGYSAMRVRADTLLCGDVGFLPFADASFDLVTSIAAFEHFLDVQRVVAEMRRVLRPGGMAWVLVHLFTSPSGGHNLQLSEVPLRTVPPGIDAWNHLRKRRLPIHVPLNEWRRDQYTQAFAVHFELLKHYCFSREGVQLLTPELASELSAYDPDELTCSAYVILTRKAG
jgi:SAM-dependent methyltransferase